MTPHGWWLPRSLDILGLLRAQLDVTVEGIDALRAWAHGDEEAAARVRECEHRADARKRELREALTDAFLTPLEPEDLFELSQGIDAVINHAKDTVREAEVMGAAPDRAMADMTSELSQGVRNLALAVAALSQRDRRGEATAAADAAIKNQRRLEHIYRAAMSALLAHDDIREVTAKRELYRRLVRTSDRLDDVAERVWYAVLKLS